MSSVIQKTDSSDVLANSSLMLKLDLQRIPTNTEESELDSFESFEEVKDFDTESCLLVHSFIKTKLSRLLKYENSYFVKPVRAQYSNLDIEYIPEFVRKMKLYFVLEPRRINFKILCSNLGQLIMRNSSESIVDTELIEVFEISSPIDLQEQISDIIQTNFEHPGVNSIYFEMTPSISKTERKIDDFVLRQKDLNVYEDKGKRLRAHSISIALIYSDLEWANIIFEDGELDNGQSDKQLVNFKGKTLPDKFLLDAQMEGYFNVEIPLETLAFCKYRFYSIDSDIIKYYLLSKMIEMKDHLEVVSTTADYFETFEDPIILESILKMCNEILSILECVRKHNKKRVKELRARMFNAIVERVKVEEVPCIVEILLQHMIYFMDVDILQKYVVTKEAQLSRLIEKDKQKGLLIAFENKLQLLQDKGDDNPEFVVLEKVESIGVAEDANLDSVISGVYSCCTLGGRPSEILRLLPLAVHEENQWANHLNEAADQLEMNGNIIESLVLREEVERIGKMYFKF